jgi:hypothetical protein
MANIIAKAKSAAKNVVRKTKKAALVGGIGALAVGGLASCDKEDLPQEVVDVMAWVVKSESDMSLNISSESAIAPQYKIEKLFWALSAVPAPQGYLSDEKPIPVHKIHLSITGDKQTIIFTDADCLRYFGALLSHTKSPHPWGNLQGFIFQIGFNTNKTIIIYDRDIKKSITDKYDGIDWEALVASGSLAYEFYLSDMKAVKEHGHPQLTVIVKDEFFHENNPQARSAVDDAEIKSVISMRKSPDRNLVPPKGSVYIPPEFYGSKGR